MTEVEIYQPNGIEPAQPAPAQAATQFDLLCAQADILAGSSIVPRQYQGQPGDIIAAGMMGAEVGWQPMTALRLIHVVEGKPEISAEGMVALVRQAGHSISGEVSSDAATVHGRRRDNGDVMSMTFTMADANRANLAGKGTYKKFPVSMLWARAVSQLCRMLFADVTLGCYVEGELTGADLHMGQPAPAPALAPPPPVDDGSGPTTDAFKGPPVYANPAEVDALLEAVKALPADDKAALKAEAAERGTRPGRNWSFKPAHKWLPLELRDCKSWVEARHGTEPWDTGPPAGVDAETGEITGTPGSPPPDDPDERDRLNRRLFAELGRHSIGDDQRHRFASVVLDREVTSFSDLDADDYAKLVAELAGAEPGEVWTAAPPDDVTDGDDTGRPGEEDW